ncbi:tRNA pseudouridine(55) synthase TruB [Desulfuromonas carbonis]|uniref:tRNA pseudouridine(55) synthase TruB n=1 Tax=Desulfuromonas sp. DDH964 TaxID=1823759 RepID=UPI00078B3AA6|nr:tRNA pseudouridine(55) synthase TruB [Desulfuromonas sp. DDH964]AMV72084.1 tRNA pseudouridine 55 synthase [Desulfuromonas sp. DDH964]
MHGILLIDKSPGMTSHDVVRRLRRLLGTRRIGHTGTLDPMATGVLPVAVGEGTRLVEFLMEGEKEYRATLRLGIATTTQDAEGETVSEASWDMVTPARLEAAAAGLRGDILQLPPMYSALKREGVPLHRLARQGIEVERQPRPVTIRSLELLQVALPLVEILVTCSKGTYIRTLAHDLGAALGCGAHLTALRRTRSGPFVEADCLTLDELEDRTAEQGPLPLLGPRAALPEMAVVAVEAAAAARLANGVPPQLLECSNTEALAEGARVLLEAAGAIAAIARFAPRREREGRGDFELLRVFANPEIWRENRSI